MAGLAALLTVAACSGGSDAAPARPATPPPPTQGTVDVLTYHNDNARSGQNLQETVLTPASVNSAGFGKTGFLAMDGKVDAQPLVAAGLDVNGSRHTAVLAASEHDSVYAFDADTGATLWQVSLLQAGETPSDPRGCTQVQPEIGVTATPVIDRNAGPHGTIWLVAMSKDAGGHYFQRLHALDLADGSERPGSPVTIAAQYPGTGSNSSNGVVTFDPAQYKERSALLLANGTVYTSWASHCDIGVYSGWVIAYDAATLRQNAVLNTEPDGSGGAFWNSGGGPAADAAGNLFLMAGNGSFDTTLVNGFPANADYGNAFTRLSRGGPGLAVADYFTMSNTVAESSIDEDLGSGGPMLLPDVQDSGGGVHHLMVGAGKDGEVYVLDRDHLGGFDATANAVWQQFPLSASGTVKEFGTPAYFDGRVYLGGVNDALRAFAVRNAYLASLPVTQTAKSFPYPGTTPSISANGSSGGIVWAVENSDPAVLHAYDAADLGHELYNSNQAANGRDHFGAGNKYITPTVADGKVFVGTPNGVAVFGRLQD
jgi:hypothetical protein